MQIRRLELIENFDMANYTLLTYYQQEMKILYLSAIEYLADNAAFFFISYSNSVFSPSVKLQFAAEILADTCSELAAPVITELNHE